MGGKSFEKALMLSHSFLKGSQVVSLQVLLHLHQILITPKYSILQFLLLQTAPCLP